MLGVIMLGVIMLGVIMLGVIMLSVIMLGVIMLGVIMPSVIMLSFVVPIKFTLMAIHPSNRCPSRAVNTVLNIFTSVAYSCNKISYSGLVTKCFVM
jgi:hypothetical protein